MKGVQCYELFGGIAIKNHTFSFSFFMTAPVSWLINDLGKVIKTKSSQCLFG